MALLWHQLLFTADRAGRNEQGLLDSARARTEQSQLVLVRDAAPLHLKCNKSLAARTTFNMQSCSMGGSWSWLKLAPRATPAAALQSGPYRLIV